MSVGTHLGGRYQLVREVGRGGFGAVFEAMDRPLNRPVAVKLIHTSWTEAGAELEHEATLLAGIRSPHVVRVLDASVMEEPPYLVMELLEGESVRQRIDKGGPLDVTEAFRILDEVLQGLSALHERTLIHGDLKPENVFLTKDGTKLIDLGISRPWTRPQERNAQVLGTPAYLSPELLRGGQPDQRADLYAAGLLIYEMLAGHAAHAQRDDLREITDEIYEGRRAPLTLVCPWLPLAVSAFVRRALEPDPVRRFMSAADMRAVLGSLRVADAPEPETSEHQLGERFVLLRPLDTGTGQIWEARDLERDTRVTVERLHLGEDRDGVQKLAALRSPHLSQLYDLVPLAGGDFVLVMEQLPGRLLTHVVGHRLPLARLGTVGGQLLAGLAAAHSVGLVHGDLRPGNIVISHFGQDPVLKIFGFQIGDGSAPPRSDAYAAPERRRGGTPTPRSDVYSAGAVLFHLLTGMDYVAAGRPFEGQSDPRTIGRVASRAAITKTLQRALAKDPAARFEDANAFLAETRDSIPPGP